MSIGQDMSKGTIQVIMSQTTFLYLLTTYLAAKILTVFNFNYMTNPQDYITDNIVYSASLSFPMAKVKMFMLHWRDLVVALDLRTEQRQLYFLSQVLYLTGEFCFQNNFDLLYKIADHWKKYSLNRLADSGDFYGIIRTLSPTEHDLTSLEYLERLYNQLTPQTCVNRS